jgi:hypothetical protein
MSQQDLARRLSRSPGMALLLCLVVAMLVASGSLVAHVHDEAKAGYYNEQHVLGSLAARTGDSPAPDAPELVAVAVVVAPVVPPAEIARPSSSLRSTASRAPPTV